MKAFTEETIESERIYEGKILNLRRDKVTTRNGESYREIVEHNGGVVIIAVTEDGMVPMVRQYRKAAEQVILEVPAGKLDEGEDPEEAALRELKEETGYTAQRITKLSSGYSSVGYSSEILHLFLAEELIPGETEPDPGESLELQLIDFKALYEMAMDGRIIDIKSVAAITLSKEVLFATRRKEGPG